jgi:tetratricopeptide (TPR) repeat protein
LQSGYVNAQAAITETKKNNVKTAVDYFEKAVKRDPFTASYKMDLAKLYHEISVKEKNGQKQIVNKEQFEKAETLVEKALKLEPYNAQLYAHAAAFMMNRGKLQEGLRYIDKSIEVQPLRPENYQQKADVYFQIGVSNLNAKKYNEAEKALKEVLNIPVAVKELNKKILKPISLTTETIEYIEKSDFLMKNYRDPNSVGKFNNLVFHSYINADVDNNGLPDGWMMINGKESQIELEITPNSSIKMLNYGKGQGFLRTRSFSLKPAKKYVLEVKLKGQLEKNNNFDVYIFSNKGKSVQFHTNSIKLEDSFKEYSFDFTTTEDIANGKQYIRFDHNGNDSGYIEIAAVNLYSVK